MGAGKREWDEGWNERRDLHKLMDHGFLICSSGDKWLLKKVETPQDDRSWDGGILFDSWDFAFAAAKIELVPLISYQVIARFNIGLGPKMETLGVVKSTSYKDADRQAKDLIQDFEHKEEMLEYKLRPI